MAAAGPHTKTLVIDLDETLIHSVSRGGRFTTGQMVEVRMRAAMGMLGPEVPILYYVHKRPYCDEFLNKVCHVRFVLLE
jgi:CTD nuclear envelope phosphatase 1